MNGQQAAFCERKRFKQGAVRFAGGRQAYLKIAPVPSDERRHLEKIRRRVRADCDIRPPPAGKLRYEIAADQGMKLKEKRVVEGGFTVLTVLDLFFQREDVARQVGRELGVAQDAKTGFDVAGRVSRRASSARSVASATGSPSKAMLSATFNGIRLRRRRACSCGGRVRQRLIVCFQSMRRIIGRDRRRLKRLILGPLPRSKPQQFCEPCKHSSPALQNGFILSRLYFRPVSFLDSGPAFFSWPLVGIPDRPRGEEQFLVKGFVPHDPIGDQIGKRLAVERAQYLLRAPQLGGNLTRRAALARLPCEPCCDEMLAEGSFHADQAGAAPAQGAAGLPHARDIGLGADGAHCDA